MSIELLVTSRQCHDKTERHKTQINQTNKSTGNKMELFNSWDKLSKERKCLSSWGMRYGSLTSSTENKHSFQVLKWDHMLSTPPQYITCLDHMSGCEDSAVFVGSQVPSEVHAFRFTIRGDNPPQAMSLPRRVDRMR